MFKDYAEKFYHVKHTQKIFENRHKQINQPIYIKNLFFYAASTDKSYGESDKSGDNINCYAAEPSVFRQRDLIKLIADMAQYYHREHYCQRSPDGSYTIKKEFENHITRALLPEFSLYSKTPLEWLAFNALVKHLSDAARTWHDNVHVLASSLAIRTHDATILNVALYIQGGSNASVTCLVKAAASHIDVTYDNTANFNQNPPWPLNTPQPIEAPNHALTSFVTAAQSSGLPLLSSDSVFTVRTKGGAEYVQAIEICLAHNLGHATYLFDQKLKLTTKQDTQFIPEQVDHLITSNHTPAESQWMLAPRITQIDPITTRATQFHSRAHDDIFADAAMLRFWRNNYAQLDILNTSSNCVIKNPPFGSELHLIVTQEHVLTPFIPKFADRVAAHNHQIMQEQLNHHLGQNMSHYKKLCRKRAELLQTFSDLYAQLGVPCRQILDWTVSSQPQHPPLPSNATSVVTKGAALQQLLKAIANSERTLSVGTTHDQDFILFNVDLICKDLVFQIQKIAKQFDQFPQITTLATQLISKINFVQNIEAHHSKEIFSPHSTNHDESSEDEERWSNILL